MPRERSVGRRGRAAYGADGHTVLDVGRAETIGGLFIEWLRAHVAPHTHHLFRAISVRIGGGATFADAFAAEIGEPLDHAEQAFVEGVGATEANPTERFRRTVFAM